MESTAFLPLPMLIQKPMVLFPGPNDLTLLQMLTIFGLLHIGSKLANPLSATKESFAVCHFVTTLRRVRYNAPA